MVWYDGMWCNGVGCERVIGLSLLCFDVVGFGVVG